MIDERYDYEDWDDSIMDCRECGTPCRPDERARHKGRALCLPCLERECPPFDLQIVEWVPDQVRRRTVETAA